MLNLSNSPLARTNKKGFWATKISDQLAIGLVTVKQVLEKQRMIGSMRTGLAPRYSNDCWLIYFKPQ